MEELFVVSNEEMSEQDQKSGAIVLEQVGSDLLADFPVFVDLPD